MIKRNPDDCKAFTLTMIQSSSNPRIQKVKKLLKGRKQNQFIVEGKKLIGEAIEAGFHFDEIFVTPEILSGDSAWIHPLQAQGTALEEITPHLMKSISDVETPQGILGVARKQQQQPIDLSVKELALLLLSIRDPGNFGAILRTAEAFGCEWIGYSSDCADPFQPKVIRSSMGSIFRIAVAEIQDVNSILKEQRKKGVSACALETRGGVSIETWKPRFPMILCVGSESHGLPPDLTVNERLSVSMKGRVESLNAAVATAVCLYAASISQQTRAH